jgi:SPP1 gp7 family putative phage head morphogenesis protein
MRFLPPFSLKQKYWLPLERAVKLAMWYGIFKPLAESLALKPEELRNSNDPLTDAVRDGTVFYIDGQFKGTFNAKISRRLNELGAVFNGTTKGWVLPQGLVPPEVSSAQVAADARYTEARRSLMRGIDDIGVESITRHLNINEKIEQAITWMDDDFAKTAKALSIPFRMTEEQKRIIAKEWGNNLEKYIVDWAAERITEMRRKVQLNAFEGRRAENLEKMLRTEYGASAAKAKFLARQETSLLLSKYQETRYKSAGVTRYRWSGADDERERPDHKALNGKIFSWDSPPITDHRTGARNNPGEDFNCRCVAVAIVE